MVRNRTLLVTVSMGSFLAPFMGSAINVALPAIGNEFSMGAASLSWVAMSYLLAAAAFLVPVGRFADIYGRRTMFLSGIGLFSIFSLAAALAPSVPFLIVARVLQGAAGAMIFSTPAALLAAVISREKRGWALGYNVAAVYLGLSVGPFVGGLLTQHFGWRSIFVVTVLLGLLTLTAAVWKLTDVEPHAAGQKFDLKGSAAYGISLVAFMYGFSNLPTSHGITLMIAGIIGLIWFIYFEEGLVHPVFDSKLFAHNRVFAFSNLATLINYCGTAAVGFTLSLYLQYVNGLSPRAAGLILVVQPVIQAIFSPLAGRLSDKKEPRIVASAGMALTAAGLLMLVFLAQKLSVPYICGCLAFLGFGFALFASPNTNAVMSSVGIKQFGVASSILGTMRLSGQMFSIGIATMVFGVVMGGMMITPSNHTLFMRCLRYIFSSLTILSVIGIYFSLVRGKLHVRKETGEICKVLNAS